MPTGEDWRSITKMNSGTATGPESAGSAFAEALRAHRKEVLQRLAPLPACGRLALMVFDVLTHLALNIDVLLDVDLVSNFAARHEVELDEGYLPASGGGRVSLLRLLTAPQHEPDGVELVNALFSLGYANKLEALSNVARRSFTLRVVGMLPGVERVGPFVLTDYVDLVCEEEDALRFWQIYVDRVAAEISRRTKNADAGDEPWLLSRLIRIHEEGPNPHRGKAWLALKRHVNRVLETRQHRWRFIRSMAEGCHDPRMLHYLCTAPAMVEDPEVCTIFLTRGNSKLISCALFALQQHTRADVVVDEILAHMTERPLPEIGERLVEIYAQLHLPARRSASLDGLAVGIRALLQDKVHDAPIDTLLGAVANDARALRQCVLLADSVQRGHSVFTPKLRQLLERVLNTFLQSFTPVGCRHALNDETFRNATRRALISLLASDVPDVAPRLEAFGLDLGSLAGQWDREDAAAQARLLGRFLGIYGYTMVGVARGLYAAPDTRDMGVGIYATLIRVYLSYRVSDEGTGWFGAIEYALPALFADLLAGEARSADPRRIDEAAAAVARIELELWPVEPVKASAAPLLFAEPPAEPEFTREVRTGPTREHPISAPVTVTSPVRGRLVSMVKAYLGVDLAAHLGRVGRRLLSLDREARITLTDQEFILHDAETVAGVPSRELTETRSFDDLVAVRSQHGMRAFYITLGAGVLATAGLLGGHLIFVGLRGAQTSLAVSGGGLVTLGLLFDSAMNWLAERNRRAVTVQLHCRTRSTPLVLLFDTATGAEVLDAFMGRDAERREIEMLDQWSGTEAWQDEPGAPDLL